MILKGVIMIVEKKALSFNGYTALLCLIAATIGGVFLVAWGRLGSWDCLGSVLGAFWKDFGRFWGGFGSFSTLIFF